MALSRNTHHHNHQSKQQSPPPSSKSLLTNNNHQSSHNQKIFITSLSFLSFALILLVLSFRPRPSFTDFSSADSLAWLGNRLQAIVRNDDVAIKSSANKLQAKGKIRIGLVNMVDDKIRRSYEALKSVETVNVDFQRVSPDLTWKMFFPTWVDEDGPLGSQYCPEIPMPRLDDHEPRYKDLDVVVAGLPCGESKINNNGSQGIRDVFRLQVNLVVANLVAAAAAVGNNNGDDDDRTVQVVFIGECGPMPEIFRCDDMLTHVGDYWVYQPDVTRLREKVAMPVGSCQIAPPFGHAAGGKQSWRSHRLPNSSSTTPQKQAYVTVLHSSESYVCGAIALAQSIKLTNSTKDLILLHDSSISPSSLAGLRAAGWTTRPITPIRSTFAAKNSYNEYNYSKLRIWQHLTDYEKVVFIDSDFILLRNMDEIFTYPQLSAGPNDRHLFNSGIMVIEPSKCTFEDLMTKTHLVTSYNGGDQGFLNEVFTWWHRLPRKVNWLKAFETKGDGKDIEDASREVPAGEGVYGLHLLGRKPWMCYRDYDCNWDSVNHHAFASDGAHRKWWEVYDAMPRELQEYCGLSREMEERIRKGRKVARKGKLKNGRWMMRIKDPRKRLSD